MSESTEHNTVGDLDPEGVFRTTKKPVTVLAMKVTTDNAEDVGNWIAARGGSCTVDAQLVHIQTLEGVMTARPGWYVLCGVEGEFYPCQPDIYAKTYGAEDPANDPNPEELV